MSRIAQSHHSSELHKGSPGAHLQEGSLGFAFGPWLFALIGSQGFLPFGIAFVIVMIAAIPVLAAWNDSPPIHKGTESKGFFRYIWLVPTATAAVLVFGAVETGGFALFPVYGARIGYPEADAALLLSMVGLGNVVLQVPLGMISDRVRDRRHLLLFDRNNDAARDEALVGGD